MIIIALLFILGPRDRVLYAIAERIDIRQRDADFISAEVHETLYKKTDKVWLRQISNLA